MSQSEPTPPPAPQPSGDSNPQKFSPLDMALMGASIAMTFYWMISYTGPFEWVAELQLRLFELYSEKITFVITFAVFYGVIYLATLPIRKMIKGGSDLGQRLDHYAGWSIVAFVGLVLACMGGRDWYRATNAGELTTVSLEQLEAGRPPVSHWCRISGFPIDEASLTFGKTGRSKDKYTPVISGVEQAEKHGIHLFLKLKEDEIADGRVDQPGTYEGMLLHRDLPGPLRVVLERENAIRDNDYYVLAMGSTPEKTAGTAKIMLWVSAAIVAFALVGSAYTAIRQRKIA